MQLNTKQLNNRVRWVRALLSDEYKQGKGKLKRSPIPVGNKPREYYYCCLGVACELIDPNHYPLALAYNDADDATSSGYLNDDFAESELGLYYKDQTVASNWNDDSDLPFSRIADYVAWSTDREITFSDLRDKINNITIVFDVPLGYAAEWLKQYEDK